MSTLHQGDPPVEVPDTCGVCWSTSCAVTSSSACCEGMPTSVVFLQSTSVEYLTVFEPAKSDLKHVTC